MILTKREDINDFPFSWINTEYLPDSKCFKKEIYTENENINDELMLLFYSLFRDDKSNILIYNESWWDFCIDTWNPNNEDYNYSIEGKSTETKSYINMLNNSNIGQGFSGVCSCDDWDSFLSIILNCLISHQAPYSPLFFNKSEEYFFYFHHTGSIGFYYKNETAIVKNILEKANDDYLIK